ncbi:MAG: ATP-binding protein [Cyclobacteriaceae bacterium]
MAKTSNPFVVVGYQGPETFCDRDVETKTLQANIRNGRNTCLISPRRLGKTALIRHVFGQLSNHTCIYVDLNKCANLGDLLKVLGSALANIPQKQSLLEKLSALRFSLDFDSMSGQYSVGFNLVKPEETKRSLSELLSLLNAQKKMVVIALDEFQQILSFTDSNVEGWLRSEAQTHSSIRFIYSGSHQRILHEMFGSKTRPFYHSAELLKIKSIDQEEYVDFMVNHFRKGKKAIDRDNAAFIYDFCYGFTAYVQLLCNHLYEKDTPKITRELILATAGELLVQYEPFYLKLKKPLTATQFQVLKAVATLSKVYAITGKDFMTTSGMTNASTVSKTVAALLKYDLLYVDTDEQGREFYAIDDVLFMRWLQRHP